jgi:Cys-rich protein (TIGR01571 family)
MATHQTTVNVQMGGAGRADKFGGGQPQNVRDWSTGVCGCFEDMGGCCMAWFLPGLFNCQLATRLDESCFVGCCLQQMGLVAMRTKLRTLYGIQGSICDDFLCVQYCTLCTMCQMDREMKRCGL